MTAASTLAVNIIRRAPPLKHRGVTLIEALITGLILAIGIIGVVSLLAMAKASQHEAMQRTRAISMGITKAESRTLTDRRRAPHHAKGRLCRMRVGAPAALA